MGMIIRLGDQLINKMETFKYLRSVVQENGTILEDITNRIRCGWIK